MHRCVGLRTDREAEHAPRIDCTASARRQSRVLDTVQPVGVCVHGLDYVCGLVYKLFCCGMLLRCSFEQG